MGSLKKIRKLVFSFLALLMVFQVVYSAYGVEVVHASSETATKALMDMAKNKQYSDIDSLSSLTEDDLQMIGVFLSNFYVPFSTEMGQSDSVDEVKDSMTQALVDCANFNSDIATQIVDYVWTMSETSAKPLNIGVLDSSGNVDVATTSGLSWNIYSQENGGTASEVGNLTRSADGGLKGSYYNFLTTWSGGYVSSKDDVTTVCDSASNKSFGLYWSDNGTNHVVFDCAFGESFKQSAKFTASSLAYALINDNLNYNQGIGSSLLSVPDFEAYDSLSADNKSLVLCMNSQLYVDCYGNILVNVGTKNYVIVPACVNPYAWYTWDSANTDGKYGASTAGDALNMINVFMLGEVEGKHITTTDGEDLTFNVYTGDQSLFNLDYWRLYRDSSTYNIDTSFFNESKETTTLRPVFENYFFHSTGGEACRFFDWSAYNGLLTSNSSLSEYSTVSEGIKTFDDFVFIDNLGTFSKSTDDSIFNTTSSGVFKAIKSKDSSGAEVTTYEPLLAKLTNDYSRNVSDGVVNTSLSSSQLKAYLVSIYSSYVFAYYEDSTTASRHVSFAYNKGNFPKPDSCVDWSTFTISDDAQMAELRSMAYYFLHPTEGISYVAEWFSNKVGGILVNWHEDMVGNTSTSNSTGTTNYIGFSGYVTIPELSDLAWTDWILQRYDSLMIYFIIIVTIIMFGYVMLGTLTFQKAVIGIIVFAICCYLPPTLINATVATSNRISDAIYGDKFVYWALVQHESYITELQASVDSDDYDNYLVTLFQDNAVNSSSNSAIVSLKWMCPKKDNYLAHIEKEIDDADSSGKSNAYKMLSGMLSKNLSGEDYLDGANNLYLYRSYSDISNYSTYIYDGIAKKSGGTYTNAMNEPNLRSIDLASGKSMSNVFDTYIRPDNSIYSSNLLSSISNGFNVSTSNITGGFDSSLNKRFYAMLGSSTLNRAINYDFDNLALNENSTSLAGIGQGEFTATLTDYTKDKTVDSNQVALSSYALMSESPFYYFSWNLFDQINASANNSDEAYKDLFTTESGGYFYNLELKEGTQGYGEMRDYMDMKSLFTVVIPMLKQANDKVFEWEDKYGLSLYDDIDVSYTLNEDGTYTLEIPEGITDDRNSELYYKWWHNLNVSRLFNMYTPWVATMYDCSYAKSEEITVAGKEFVVEDPIDPSSYPGEEEGRPMIFSRSEMEFWGLDESDLTQVESKILEVEDNSYDSLLELMNYYNFDNQVLNTAAGMTETFEFNKVFSETSLLGTSYTLYPQSYELKNFSYDAFLRLILSNTTGEELQSENGSLYSRVVENSSITTGIVLVILDFFAIYAIPALKLFFLLAIFGLSILMILASTIKIEINIATTLWKSLVSPLLKFLAVSVGMAWVISLFMSNGNTAVTGSDKLSISLGDPVMVLGIMLIINLVVLVLYFKIVKGVAKECIRYGSAVGNSVVGVGGGLITKGLGLLVAGKVASNVLGGGYASGGGNAVTRGAMNGARSAMHGISGVGKSAGKKAGNSTLDTAKKYGTADGRMTNDMNKASKYADKESRLRNRAENQKNLAESYRKDANNEDNGFVKRKYSSFRANVSDTQSKVSDKLNERNSMFSTGARADKAKAKAESRFSSAVNNSDAAQRKTERREIRNKMKGRK